MLQVFELEVFIIRDPKYRKLEPDYAGIYKIRKYISILSQSNIRKVWSYPIGYFTSFQNI